MKPQHLIFGIALMILLLGSVSASTLGEIRKGECITLPQSGNFTSCVIKSIQYPNKSVSIYNYDMEKNGSYFYYENFCDTYSSGNYIVTTECDELSYPYDFDVNPTGSSFSMSESFLFSGFLFLFILFLISGIYGLSRAINGAWQVAYICLAYLSLFCIFFIGWLYSSNYLYYTPIMASIFWILWVVMAFGFFPFIFVVGAYIVGKGIKDNLFKQYKAEGFSDEEAKDMIKKRR
jgi:hypothetical protein